MKIQETKLKGCFVITPKVFEDNRGMFYEAFHEINFHTEVKSSIHFVQDNISQSKNRVLRGLHFQIGEHAQAKLVSVLRGKVQDVCVDLRKYSPTFGKYVSVILDAKEKKQLFIPRGFAHGFLTLEENTIFSYKCDNYYNKSAEAGIIYNDATLNINWQLPEKDLILSEKDKTLPTFNAIQNVL